MRCTLVFAPLQLHSMTLFTRNSFFSDFFTILSLLLANSHVQAVRFLLFHILSINKYEIFVCAIENAACTKCWWCYLCRCCYTHTHQTHQHQLKCTWNSILLLKMCGLRVLVCVNAVGSISCVPLLMCIYVEDNFMHLFVSVCLYGSARPLLAMT